MFSHNSPYKKGDQTNSSDKTKKALQSLGLTDYEARAYLSLVEFGPLTANEVSGRFMIRLPSFRTGTLFPRTE